MKGNHSSEGLSHLQRFSQPDVWDWVFFPASFTAAAVKVNIAHVGSGVSWGLMTITSLIIYFV